MTESFVTQCPHCQTSFRVSYHQLSAARGAVRCGSCLQVFNAARQLLEKSTGQSAAALFGEAPPTGASAEHVPEISARETSSPDPTAPAPEAPAYRRVEPISQRRWAAAAEIDLEHLDLDNELARLEQRFTPRHGNPEHSGRDDSLSARRDEPEAAHDPFDDDHSLIEPPLGEPQDNAQALRGQSPLPQGGLRAERDGESAAYHYLPGDARTPAPLVDGPLAPLIHEQADDEEDRAEPSLSRLEDEFDDIDRRAPLHDKRQRRSAIEAADESLRRVDAAPLKPAGKARRAEPRMRDADLPDLSEDPLELQWQKPHSSWGKRLFWSFLALIAALTLAGQYVAYHFDELARQDAYRPWFQQLCPVVGCTVPSKVDIALIKSSNLVVRSHPQFSGALIVDAIIYNRAPFSQPFPLLELRFADLDGKLIASRRFKPSEYLSGDLAGQTDMPPQTPIHIALDILDPGSKAVNYSLSFQSPE
jgi:predicted Zn finger-like uncharacterized protein